MMRRITLGLLAGLALGCGPLPWEQDGAAKHRRSRPLSAAPPGEAADEEPAPAWAAGLAADVRQEMEDLQGTWVVMRARRRGEVEQALAAATVTMNGDRFVSRMENVVAARGSWTVDPTATPRAIDVAYTGGPDTGQNEKGIYHREGDVWVVLFGGPGKPRPTAFEAPAEPEQTFLTLQRATPRRAPGVGLPQRPDR